MKPFHRPSWALEKDFIDPGDARSIASAANHAFAKRVNDLYRQGDLGDNREILAFYWRCHDEVFAILDTLFCLTIESTTTPAEALVISSALDKHIDACIERWRVKHIAMLEDQIAAFEAEDEYHRQRRISHPYEYLDPAGEIPPPPPAKPTSQQQAKASRAAPTRRRTMFDTWTRGR